ncbi:hypothetical protein [Tenacibaculum sp.]|uniref:hypothetical protein n=1 Tax=Tenacibaculum sp. TaxID=1906242 RepID=UPI003D111920
MNSIKSKIYNYHQELIEKNKTITARALKNSYLGIEEKQIMLLDVFKTHNNQIKTLVGKEYALNTLKDMKQLLIIFNLL